MTLIGRAANGKCEILPRINADGRGSEDRLAKSTTQVSPLIDTDDTDRKSSNWQMARANLTADQRGWARIRNHLFGNEKRRNDKCGGAECIPWQTLDTKSLLPGPE